MTQHPASQPERPLTDGSAPDATSQPARWLAPRLILPSWSDPRVAALRPVILSVAICWLALPAVVHSVGLGEVAPENARATELVDLAGQRQSLENLWGANGMLILFASNTCPYMIDWLDRLPRIADFADANEIAFVVVNANARKRANDDSPAAMGALADEHGFTFPYWIDEESRLADALDAKRTPEVFLYDATQTLVYHGALDDHSGPFDQVTEHWALDALRQMITGEDVANATTTPIGCAVQRPRRRPTRPGT